MGSGRGLWARVLSIALMIAAGPVMSAEPVTVPFLDAAPETYTTAFLTAVRGYDSLGVSGLMQDVETCYDNIRGDELVKRTQYCFFLHASTRMLEMVVPTRRAKLPPADQIGDVRERAQFSLVQAGYSPADSLVILSAWSKVGQAALPSTDFREFKRLVMKR